MPAECGWQVAGGQARLPHAGEVRLPEKNYVFFTTNAVSQILITCPLHALHAPKDLRAGRNIVVNPHITTYNRVPTNRNAHPKSKSSSRS